MINYIVVSIASGILFGILDAAINANQFARRLYEIYRPIARTSVNVGAGISIDLMYGFALAGIFLLIYDGIPGQSDVVKGMTYGILMWFFRVVMQVASQWVMFTVPVKVHVYTLAAGLGEMMILGTLYGLTLAPSI